MEFGGWIREQLLYAYLDLGPMCNPRKKYGIKEISFHFTLLMLKYIARRLNCLHNSISIDIKNLTNRKLNNFNKTGKSVFRTDIGSTLISLWSNAEQAQSFIELYFS